MRNTEHSLGLIDMAKKKFYRATKEQKLSSWVAVADISGASQETPAQSKVSAQRAGSEAAGVPKTEIPKMAAAERPKKAAPERDNTPKNNPKSVAALPADGNPIRRISLGLSGGGFRAVGYHLGTLSYLHHLGLLDHVKRISTVSGGTYVGVKWVLSMIEEAEFEDFFKSYYEFNEKVNLMELMFHKLHGPLPPTPSQRHDMMVNLADVHADTLTRDPAGKSYLFKTVLEANLPLDDIFFNATELRHGLSFSFRKSADPTAYSGSPRIKLDKKESKLIRMADIVAASSAFPGPMEPISFPDDFVWPDRDPPPKTKAQFTRDGVWNPVALADGCIYDNQGIENLVLHDQNENDPSDLLLVSDTDQHFDNICPVPPVSTGPMIPVRTLVRIWLALITWSVLATLFVAYRMVVNLSQHKLDWEDLLVYLIPLTLGFSTIIGMGVGFRMVRTVLQAGVPDIFKTAWNGMRFVRLRSLQDMLKMRMHAVGALNEKFYGKRMRDLLYAHITRDPKYDGRLVPSRIYELSDNAWPDELPADVQKTSRELGTVAKTASKIGTNLWFDTPYELPCLAAAGQAILCQQLMVWVAKRYGSDVAAYPKPVRELWDRLVEDWDSLCDDPYSLLQEYLPGKTLAKPPAAKA